MLAIVDRLSEVHREILPDIRMMVQKSQRTRGTTALIGISPFLAGCIIFTYLYVNTSEFDDTTHRLPQIDAARIRALSKPSNGQNGKLECVLRVIACS
jgi:hypothetical protein